mgnify:CR=1 FL=1
MILNRRHLRIKVLQALYAFYQSDNEDVLKGEKELLHSVNKIYDLYLTYLSLFPEIKHLAELRIEEAKEKRLPTEEDLDPSLRFVRNEVLKFYSVNQQLKSECELRKISWTGDQELPRKTFRAIRESDAYEQYLGESQSNELATDKAFMEKMFREHIANSELLLQKLDEDSIYWGDDIDLVCNMVIRHLNTIQEGWTESDKLFRLFKDPKEDRDFIVRLFRQTIKSDTVTEEMIDGRAENWELDRIALMDRLLMKMAITEAREFPSIPVKVSLNEYIEISKFYSTPKSNSFINGILDRVFLEMKQKGDMKKTGRGLIE